MTGPHRGGISKQTAALAAAAVLGGMLLPAQTAWANPPHPWPQTDFFVRQDQPAVLQAAGGTLTVETGAYNINAGSTDYTLQITAPEGADITSVDPGPDADYPAFHYTSCSFTKTTATCVLKLHATVTRPVNIGLKPNGLTPNPAVVSPDGVLDLPGGCAQVFPVFGDLYASNNQVDLKVGVRV
ncbi:hypothetical protein [Streptomyces melanogenes]|uniref:hypothetical protein n=1 Tax=Streptomyces melanogenes TaxID=67326 RepID=UPI00167EF21C|nr:hypothetical protein [Streptomyces melanogenes]GGP86344.1 hypothetical protein GCM10010278_75950 [Streptomyces melanogenes]